MFDGKRIAADDTPEKLEMEDNDSIDVVIEQVGLFPTLSKLSTAADPSFANQVGGRL